MNVISRSKVINHVEKIVLNCHEKNSDQEKNFTSTTRIYIYIYMLIEKRSKLYTNDNSKPKYEIFDGYRWSRSCDCTPTDRKSITRYGCDF